MSGRGHDINVPAWMQRQQQQPYPSNKSRRSKSRSRSRSPPRRRLSPPRDYNRRPPPPRFRGGRDPYSRNNYRGNRPPRRGEIYFQSLGEEREWLEKRRRNRLGRKSKFDVEPSPSDIVEGVNAQQRYLLQQQSLTPVSLKADALQPQQTRHARRLYIGQLPLEVNESEVHKFFREAINIAMNRDPSSTEEDPILSVYINRERRFAFVEFKTLEICTACLSLDGIDVLGKGKVKVKRPNDYNPVLAATTSCGELPHFDVSKLGIVSASVQDGPNKIFIGGLPYHLTDDQVMELLRAFGPVRSFHLVKADVTASSSKGYCFVEYIDANVTPVAIMGLNGMDMGGGKVLSARMAASKPGDDPTLPPVPSTNIVGGVDVDELLNVAFAGSGTLPPESLPVLNSTPQDLAMKQMNMSLGSELQSATNVLVLLNMVTDEDLSTDEFHEELVDEVKIECEKYGEVLSLKIPRTQDGYASTAVKKIFLQYESSEQATSAYKELSGRKFGDSVVKALFFDPDLFTRGILS